LKKGNDGYYRKTFTFDGKRYSVRSKSPDLLYEKIAQIKQDLKNGTKAVNGNTLVQQWAYEWLETYKKNSVRQGSYERFKRNINNILLPEVGNMRIKDIQQVHLQRILNSLKGSSEDHIRKVQNMIFNIFERAKKSNMILANPADDLELPMAEPDTSHRTITEDERKYILELSKAHRAGLWVLTLLYCGLRPGETIPLTWNDIDFERAVLKITKAYERKNSEFKTPKSKAGTREIPIPTPLYERLKVAYPKDKPFEFIFQQFDQTKEHNPNGKHHTDTTLGNMWNDFKNELDIMMGAKYDYRGQRRKKYIVLSVVAEDLVPYCLRHTYCTDLEAAGVPINVAARLMGHANIQLTSKIYTHRSEVAFESAAAAINKYYAPDTIPSDLGDAGSDTSKTPKTHKKQYS